MHTTTTGGRALETRLARSLCGSVLCSKRESSSPFISISQNALRNRIAAAEVDPPKQQFGYFDVFWFCFDPGLDGTGILPIRLAMGRNPMEKKSENWAF